MRRWLLIGVLLCVSSSLAWAQAGRPIVEGQACGGNLTGTYPNCTAPGTPPGGATDSFQVNDGAGGFRGVGSHSTGTDASTFPGSVSAGGTTAGYLELFPPGGGNGIRTQAPATVTAPRVCTLEDDDTPYDSCITPGGGGAEEVSEYFDAAGCNDGTTATLNWDKAGTPAVPTTACVTGGDVTIGVADFPAASDACMTRNFRLRSNITAYGPFNIIWQSADTTPTNNVIWEISTVCQADGEALPSFGANVDQLAADAVGTANTRNIATLATPTVTGCASQEQIYVRVCRRSASAGTSGNDGRIQGVQMRFTRTLP